MRTTAAYDTAGRVSSTTVADPLGDGRSVRTTYTFDHRWSAPTGISTYAVEVNGATSLLAGSVSMGYDDAGNLAWRQQGNSRTDFRYYASGPAVGQLRAVQSPPNGQGQVAVDSLWYDVRGNLVGSRDPLGFVTVHERDDIEREKVTYTPIGAAGATSPDGVRASGARLTRHYDVMGRDTLTRTYGPEIVHDGRGNLGTVTTPQEELLVRTVYDEEGLPRRVVRRAIPDASGVDSLATEYEYDRAGRKIRETDGAQTQRFGYDRAGNLTSWTTGRGYTIATRADACTCATATTIPPPASSHRRIRSAWLAG